MKALLRENGFEYARSKGDHDIYKRGNKTVVVNKNLNKMVARRIIKENNLKEDWSCK